MIASSVLLNCALTVGTLLRIALDPIRGLTVIFALLQPHLRDATHDWAVVAVNGTSKAELVLLGYDRGLTATSLRLGLGRLVGDDPAGAA